MKIVVTQELARLDVCVGASCDWVSPTLLQRLKLMGLIQVGVTVTCSRKKESSASVPRRARPSPPPLHIVHTTWFELTTSFNFCHKLSKRESRPGIANFGMQVWSLLLFRPFLHKFSLFLIDFIQDRVLVLPSPLSRCFSSLEFFIPWEMRSTRIGLTSLPIAVSWIDGCRH